MEPEKFSRRENLAQVAHSITGGFEAPIQLTMTIWLMLRGIINNDFSFGSLFIDLKLPTDTFGNVVPLPTISIVSTVFSIVSMCVAGIRLNIPGSYKDYGNSLSNERILKILKHIPFFLCSIIFRVMSNAFIWLFLHLWSFIPLCLSLLSNAYIGYNYNQQFRERMEGRKKRIGKQRGSSCKSCKKADLEKILSDEGEDVSDGAATQAYISQHGKKTRRQKEECCTCRYQIVGLSKKIRIHLKKKLRVKEDFIRYSIDRVSKNSEKSDEEKEDQVKYLESKLKVAEKERRKIDQERKLQRQGSEYMDIAVWLSSFVGIWVPCCYSQPLPDATQREIHKEKWVEVEQDLEAENAVDDETAEWLKRKILEERNENNDLLEILDKTRFQFSKKVVKLQEIIGSLINFFCIAIVWYLVNNNKLAHNDNKLTNFSFNVYSTVLMTYCLLCQIFTFLDFDIRIPKPCLASSSNSKKNNRNSKRKTKKVGDDVPDGPLCRAGMTSKKMQRRKEMEEKENFSKILTQFLVTIFLCSLVVAPALAGGWYNHTRSPTSGFAVVVSGLGSGQEDRMSLSMVKIYKVNTAMITEWSGKIQSCKRYFEENFNSEKATVILANLMREDCRKHFQRKNFEKKVASRKDKNDVILIWENWENRSSSPFPKRIYDTDQTDFLFDIEYLKSVQNISIFSFNKKDNFGNITEKIEFMDDAATAANTEMRIVLQGMEKLLDNNSPLFKVSCSPDECVRVNDPQPEDLPSNKGLDRNID